MDRHGFGRSSRDRYVRNRRESDHIPAVDIGESIRQLRRIYKEYTDQQFASWYSVRYGIRPEAVLAVVKGGLEREMATGNKRPRRDNKRNTE